MFRPPRRAGCAMRTEDLGVARDHDAQQGIVSRRRFVAGVAASAFTAGGPAPTAAASVCQDADLGRPYRRRIATPLGEADPTVAWGVHLEGATMYDAALVKALGEETPKVLAIGSGLKFGNLHPLSIACEREDHGEFYSTWSEPDEIVTLARRLGATVRGDALVWNDWPPAWIAQLVRDRPPNWRDKLQGAFERHIAVVFQHFDELEARLQSPVMPWCGIVNEPFEAWGLSAGGFPWRTGPWLDAFDADRSGAPGYIRKAFELAEKYSRASRPALYLNEAGCESDRFGKALRPAILSLIANLKEAGCKIDAIGLESHLMPQWMDEPARPNWRPFVSFLNDLGALGVQVYLTELDVNDCMLTGADERDRLVADYTGDFVKAAMDSPLVSMVTNWDFSDNYSWLRDDGSPNATFPTLARWAVKSLPSATPFRFQ
jgi:endo-1,4-beta-xylanase